MTKDRGKSASKDPLLSASDEPVVVEEMMIGISCRGTGDRPVEVIQYRHVAISQSERGERRSVGAIGWRTSDGERVRQIDRDLYEVVSSGELLERVD